MNTTTMRDLRANMKAHFDAVEDNQDVLLIPRSGKKEAIVIMTLSEYNSMTETDYLLSSESNRKFMEEAKRQLEAGEVVEFELQGK